MVEPKTRLSQVFIEKDEQIECAGVTIRATPQKHLEGGIAVNKSSFTQIVEEIAKRLIALIDRLKNEPVMVRTFLVLLASAGVIEVSDTQIDRIEAITLAGLLLLGSTSIRRNVTPVAPEDRKPLLRRRSQGGGNE
jgi:hypothetical protein